MDGSAWFAGPEHQPFTFSTGVGQRQALLLHGFAGTPAELRPLGQALADAGVAAHAPLLPGFGPDMDRLGQVGPEDWLASAREAWQRLRANARGPTLLVGFSMGGSLALRLAAEAPPDRLVLVAPLWRLLGPAWPLGALLPLVRYVLPSIGLLDRGAGLDNPQLRSYLARAMPGLDLDEPQIREELRRRVRMPISPLVHLWRLAGSAGTAARQITAPTLVVQGIADRTVLVRDTRSLARRLAGSVEQHELPVGHLLLDPATPTWPTVRRLIVDFGSA